MDHLDAATLEEFKAFNKKFYIPNNAVLVVAGDINIEKTKELISKYYANIPMGTPIKREAFVEDAITETLTGKYHDSNIKIPALLLSYRTPSMKTRDARILDMISTILSDGKSSRLYKKMVDDKKEALQVGAINVSLEDYGMYVIYGLPLGETKTKTLLKDIDEEIVKLQTELISEREFQKLKNIFENRFVNSNASVEGIANSLARYYMLYGDINLINNEIDIYNSITREEIKAVANKYLNANQRLVFDYLPKEEKNNN